MKTTVVLNPNPVIAALGALCPPPKAGGLAPADPSTTSENAVQETLMLPGLWDPDRGAQLGGRPDHPPTHTHAQTS